MISNDASLRFTREEYVPIPNDLHSGNMGSVELHVDIGVFQERYDKPPSIRTAN